jgi:hypothetical protein
VIFFFDRSVGIKIPQALRLLDLPDGVQFHQENFQPDEKDDVWLPVVGGFGWFVIGQDYRYHRRPHELAALKQHSVGCFYLWGAQARKWETVRVFARAYDRIVNAASNTPRPFVFSVDRNGRLRQLALP